MGCRGNQIAHPRVRRRVVVDDDQVVGRAGLARHRVERLGQFVGDAGG